ncbi:MAG: molybdopterin-guanine dinucleotide biosynthesis protein B [Fimbriimonadaceae bacterium]|nr:molybdopterin-guanine dinucleotide biosynthesis protein B [Fimbriimonadaceae bacterium]
MPVDVDRARELVLQASPALPATECPLAQALGRHLARDIVAQAAHPAADNSAMDGYAVRAADLVGASATQPARLRLVGASEAGRPFSGTVAAGQAVRIFTGGLIPAGADAVVRQEEAQLDATAEAVECRRPVCPGHDIRRAGEEWLPGDCLLPAGSRLNAAAVGLLAAAGYPTAPVHRRPRVVLAVTGDELASPGDPAGGPRVHDANTPMLLAWLREQGAELGGAVRLPDDTAAVATWLAAQVGQVDLVITAGGASVGDRDVIAAAWQRVGWETAFAGVAMKPGKPVRFGWGAGPGGRTLAFALPGNPLAALAGAEQFVAPCLTALSGGTWAPPARVRLPLATAWPASGGRRYLLRAAAVGEPQQLQLSPRQGSAILREAAGQHLVAHLNGRPQEVGSLVEATAEATALRGLVLRPSAALPLAVGVWGYSNSGKTRLVELLIPRLQAAGLRVGPVKHASHATQVDRPGSDSHRHAAAGAQRVLLLGPQGATLFAPDAPDADLWPWLESFAGQVDLVLVEGFKHRLLPSVWVEPQDCPAGRLEAVAGDLPAWRLVRPATACYPDLFEPALVDQLAGQIAGLRLRP